MNTNQPLRSLTVKQPWASSIVWGLKDIENRTQRTHIRGTVLIHAGAQWYQGAKNNAYSILTTEQKATLSDEQALQLQVNALPLGAIIGEVEIVDCVQNHPSVWAVDGYWHWVVKNAVLYPEPIPCKGALSFWKIPEHLEEAVMNQRWETLRGF